MRESPTRFLPPLSLLLVAAVFVHQLPSTVQNLDSGELVANSFRLNVIHPSGYPLYLWLQYVWIHIFSFGSIFWRAAFLNALFAVGALAIISWRSRQLVLVSVCVVLPLAFSGVFWSYALVPDVFMLNGLVLAALCAIYLHAADSKARVFSLCFLFALGTANHLSIVFALPLLADALFGGNRSWKTILLAVTASGIFVVLAYASLLLLHTDSIYSWGRLHTIGDLVRHFLRSDYGTLRLTGHDRKANIFENILALGRMLVVTTPLSLVLASTPLYRIFSGQSISRRYLVVLGSMLAYVVIFMGLANVDPKTAERLVLERFFLVPLVMLAGLAGFGLNASEWPLRGKLGIVLLLAGLGSSVANYLAFHQETNFARNTIVEDYARNVLNMVNDDSRAIVIADSSTKVFALHYLQLVKAEHSRVLVLAVGILFDPRQLEKIKAIHPDFRIDPGFDKGSDARDVFKYFVDPNIEKFDFYFAKDVNPGAYRITFLGLGRKITVGSGVAFDESSVARITRFSSTVDMPGSPDYNEYKALYAEYAYYFLKRGLAAKSKSEAIGYFSQALTTVPYCTPALSNICSLKHTLGEDTDDCLSHLAKLKELKSQYF